MPQIDAKYSQDLNGINFQALFQAIETAINSMDDTAGVCKSRAYPTRDYLHAHFYIRIAMLKKPHRNPVFMKKCLDKLGGIVKSALPGHCSYSVELDFCSDYYLTSQV